jgi:hypothetical protein
MRTGTDKGQRGTRLKFDVDRDEVLMDMLIGSLFVRALDIGQKCRNQLPKSLLLRCAPEYSTRKAVKERKETHRWTEQGMPYIEIPGMNRDA